MDEEVDREDIVEVEDGKLIRDWAVVRQIGHGAYGDVYHVINIKDDTQGAMKVEALAAEEHCLRIELEVLQSYDKATVSFIKLLGYGTSDNFSFIVMTLCGADLTRLLAVCGSFSDSTLLRLAIRTMIAIKSLHEIGYVHRDIKPCNFASALDGSKVVHVIDFGMTKRYAMRKDKTWILKKKRPNVAFRGTLRYCAVSMHQRKEQGRVDDLWSWLYMTVEFRCSLPWKKITHQEAISACKEDTTDIQLFGRDNLTTVLIPIAQHLRTLSNYDRPDYLMIFETLAKAIKEREFGLFDDYDWEGKLKDDGKDVAERINNLYVKYEINQPRKSAEKHPKADKEAELKEWAELRKACDMASHDVPGGEKFIEQKKVKKDNKDKDVVEEPATDGPKTNPNGSKERPKGEKEGGSLPKQKASNRKK